MDFQFHNRRFIWLGWTALILAGLGIAIWGAQL